MFSFCTLSLLTSYLTFEGLLKLTPAAYFHYFSPSIYAFKYSTMTTDFLYCELTLVLHKKLVVVLSVKSNLVTSKW